MSKHSQRNDARRHDAKEAYKLGVNDRAKGYLKRNVGAWRHRNAYTAGYNRKIPLPVVMGLTEQQNGFLARVLEKARGLIQLPPRAGKLNGRKASIIAIDDPLEDTP